MKNIVALIFSMLAISATYTQWSIDSLNTPGSGLIYGNTSTKAVFVHGGEWDVFDVFTNTHTSGALSLSRTMIEVAQYGEKVYFGGGKYGYFADPLYTKYVDVYNAASDTWSVLQLSKAREVGGAAAIGNKIVFAGGSGRDFGGPVYLYNKVDIFDAVTGARTTAKISKARSNIAAGAAGDKIVFAGGWYWDMMYNVLQSNVVDIYNTTTNTWTKTTLSKKRENIAVAVIGNKIIFAGGNGGAYGGALKNVDIYDVSTNAWTTTMMPVARYGMRSVVVGTKAYFTGGIGGALNTVHVYDATTNTWSNLIIPVTLSNFSMSAINGKVYFAGGYNDATATFSNLVQIYDPATNSWSNDYLSQARSTISTAVVGSFGVFAGGINSLIYPTTYSNRVDIFEAPFRAVWEEEISKGEPLDISIYPNPSTDVIRLLINDELLLPVECVVYDRIGRTMMTFTLYNSGSLIDISELPVGTYIISATNISNQHVVKTIVKQ